MAMGKSDVDIDDTTDEMMDMLVKTVTSKQKSRVRRRERSSMANRKSRKMPSFILSAKNLCFKVFILGSVGYLVCLNTTGQT